MRISVENPKDGASDLATRPDGSPLNRDELQNLSAMRSAKQVRGQLYGGDRGHYRKGRPVKRYGRVAEALHDRISGHSDGTSALCARADFLLKLFGIMNPPAHCKHGMRDHPATGQRPREGTHHGKCISCECAFSPQYRKGPPGSGAGVAPRQT
jgi:hypothetical protein